MCGLGRPKEGEREVSSTETDRLMQRFVDALASMDETTFCNELMSGNAEHAGYVIEAVRALREATTPLQQLSVEAKAMVVSAAFQWQANGAPAPKSDGPGAIEPFDVPADAASQPLMDSIVRGQKVLGMYLFPRYEAPEN